MNNRWACAMCHKDVDLQSLTMVDGRRYCEECVEKQKLAKFGAAYNAPADVIKTAQDRLKPGNKMFGHPRFYEILEQMKELHSRKNHDYAGTSDPLKNLRACERLELKPFMGVMVRLQDKWSRLEEFVKSGSLMVKNESVIDTLLDNAVYSVLAIILYEEQHKQESTPGYGGNCKCGKTN